MRENWAISIYPLCLPQSLSVFSKHRWAILTFPEQQGCAIELCCFSVDQHLMGSRALPLKKVNEVGPTFNGLFLFACSLNWPKTLWVDQSKFGGRLISFRADRLRRAGTYGVEGNQMVALALGKNLDISAATDFVWRCQ